MEQCRSRSPELFATTNAFYAVVGSAYGVLEYCASKGNSVADEYISKVQLGTINNTNYWRNRL
jgi:hypothetical protein